MNAGAGQLTVVVVVVQVAASRPDLSLFVDAPRTQIAIAFDRRSCQEKLVLIALSHIATGQRHGATCISPPAAATILAVLVLGSTFLVSNPNSQTP